MLRWNLLVVLGAASVLGLVGRTSAAEVGKLLEDSIAEGPQQEYRNWARIRTRGWEAVKAKNGVLKLLVEAAAHPDTPVEVRWLALGIVAEADTEGRQAEAVLNALNDNPLPQDKLNSCWEPASTDVQLYLFRSLRGPKDVERLSDAILASPQNSLVFVRRVMAGLPPDTQTPVCLRMLDRVVDPAVMNALMGRVSYYLGGDAVRDKMLQIASDEKREASLRREAAKAYAARCTRADYDRVEELLRSVTPWKDYPPDEAIQTLSTLDWKRAVEKLNERWKDQPPSAADVRMLSDFGGEAQVQEALAAAANGLKDGDPAVVRRSKQAIETFGGRDLGDLPNKDDFAQSYNPLQTCFRLGIDPEPYLKHAVEFSPSEDVLRMSGSWDDTRYLPERLRKSCGPDFVEVALRVLRQYPTDRDDLADWERQELRDAFNTLCLLAPEKAEPLIERFARNSRNMAAAFLRTPAAKQALVRIFREDVSKDDPADEEWSIFNKAEPLLVAGGPEQMPFLLEAARHMAPPKQFRLMQAVSHVDPAAACAEFAKLLAAEGCSPRGFQMSMSMVRTGETLADEQRQLAETPLLAAMRNSAGSPRLDYAVILAALGNAEGERVVEGFLKGDWRPQTNYWNSFMLFVRSAAGPETPTFARARRLLVRAVSEPPDPTVRAAIVKATRGQLGFRDGDRGGYPLVEMLLSHLAPDQDWRVRYQSAVALRLAFRDVKPDWDYYHFWPVERQRRSADEIRRWWQENKDRLRWVVEPGPFGISGVFALQP